MEFIHCDHSGIWANEECGTCMRNLGAMPIEGAIPSRLPIHLWAGGDIRCGADAVRFTESVDFAMGVLDAGGRGCVPCFTGAMDDAQEEWARAQAETEFEARSGGGTILDGFKARSRAAYDRFVAIAEGCAKAQFGSTATISPAPFGKANFTPFFAVSYDTGALPRCLNRGCDAITDGRALCGEHGGGAGEPGPAMDFNDACAVALDATYGKGDMDIGLDDVITGAVGGGFDPDMDEAAELVGGRDALPLERAWGWDWEDRDLGYRQLEPMGYDSII